MRKFCLSLLLPLFMLLAQQGAVWHEIGHLGRAATTAAGSAGADAPRQQPLDRLCASCLSFAHLAAAAGHALPALPPVALRHALTATAAAVFIAADAPSARSRGPPAAL
jgi:hypothetical protein